MKSDICTLSANDIESLKKVLSETEKTAVYAALDKKQSGRLRLLAEELVEMLPSLLAFTAGEFWIDCNGKNFELHTTLTPRASESLFFGKKCRRNGNHGENPPCRYFYAHRL